MKRKIILSFATLIVFLAGILPAPAQGKIAIVDMKKVLDKYNKKTVAEQAIKDMEEAANKDQRTLVDQLKKLNEEYEKLLSASYDQSITPEEREKRKGAAESKGAEIQTQQRAIRGFQDTVKDKIETQSRRMLDKIVAEIRAAVTAKAKASGYSMVLDSSGDSTSLVPLVLYTNGENDLTDAVINQLNTTTPAPESATNASSPGGSK